MDEDIEIINSQTRNEKIKNFFLSNKNYFISFLILVVLILIGFFSYEEYNSSKKEKLADKYDLAVIRYGADSKYNVIPELKEVINSKDKTYSPLAFYFLLDNDLINSKKEINKFFDIIINEIGLDKKFKELTIFKKGLYNSDHSSENELLEILNPLIKSESVWKPHSLYIMAEYYFAKNQMQKSKEFFEQIINLENNNSKIKTKAQKRLISNFSE
tara:strand:+ start:215 stop:859 length:645 start_codon:yes stop_codon:yes gene_type:complete